MKAERSKTDHQKIRIPIDFFTFTSFALTQYGKRHRLYKNYLIGLGLTIISFSMISAFCFPDRYLTAGFLCTLLCMVYTFFLYLGLKKLGEIKGGFQTLLTILTFIVPFIPICIQITVFFRFIR